MTVAKEVLRFDRPLLLTDKGVYKCVATNIVGSGKVDLEIQVTGMYLWGFVNAIYSKVAVFFFQNIYSLAQHWIDQPNTKHIYQKTTVYTVQWLPFDLFRVKYYVFNKETMHILGIIALTYQFKSFIFCFLILGVHLFACFQLLTPSACTATCITHNYYFFFYTRYLGG